MITFSDLEELAQNPTNSWAIWNTKGINDFDFFKSNIDRLHTKVVLMGLNRSDGAHQLNDRPFINFHTTNHRGNERLRRFIQENELTAIIGGLMTDLSLEIETDSNNVHIESKQALKELQAKLSFSESCKRTIICIGDKPFNNLCEALDINWRKIKKDSQQYNLRNTQAVVGEEEWDIYRVWMHSSWGKYEDKGEVELPLQLNYINQQIKQ